LSELLREIMKELESYATEVELLIPYDKVGVLSRLHDQGKILAVEHASDGIKVNVMIPRSAARSLRRFLLHRDTEEL
jgi:GTP-binding protein HflX